MSIKRTTREETSCKLFSSEWRRERRGASFDFSRSILDAVENFGGLIHQLESVSAGGWYGRTNKTQYVLIFCERQTFLLGESWDLCWCTDYIVNSYGKKMIKAAAGRAAALECSSADKVSV